MDNHYNLFGEVIVMKKYSNYLYIFEMSLSLITCLFLLRIISFFSNIKRRNLNTVILMH